MVVYLCIRLVIDWRPVLGAPCLLSANIGSSFPATPLGTVNCIDMGWIDECILSFRIFMVPSKNLHTSAIKLL